MIGMSSSNFLFKTFLSTSNTTFELLLHFFYIGGNMLPASILSFVFSSKNELYMVWAGRRDPWWGWLRGWEHAIWLGCYYLFRKQRKCLLTQLQIAPLPSLASLTVRIFSWGTKLKRDWERSNPPTPIQILKMHLTDLPYLHRTIQLFNKLKVWWRNRLILK